MTRAVISFDFWNIFLLKVRELSTIMRVSRGVSIVTYTYS